MYLFSINICSKFNTHIYIQQFYLFTKLLSIQKLFIHSTTFYSFKIYCTSLLRMEVTTSCSGWTGASKKLKRSLELWKIYWLLLHWGQRGKASPIGSFHVKLSRNCNPTPSELANFWNTAFYIPQNSPNIKF